VAVVQEAHVLQRVGELRRTGLWSSRRLPKVQETPRCKAHWDYVVDEMRWLAVDFAQERRWKMAAAKQVKSSTVISLSVSTVRAACGSDRLYCFRQILLSNVGKNRS